MKDLDNFWVEKTIGVLAKGLRVLFSGFGRKNDTELAFYLELIYQDSNFV